MRFARISFLVCVVLLASCQDSSSGLIVHNARVLDGDSLIAVTQDNLKLELRLAEIDAPERDQPHANDARSALRELVDSERLRVEIFDHDRYDRTVVHLYRVRDGLHINAAMVEDGHAWVYRKFLRDRSLLTLEEKAKANRAGLWAQGNPVAPWNFRADKRRRN